MWDYAPEHYHRAGTEALRAIGFGLEGANVLGVRSILDFACGGGRVMRHLRAKFPDAEITGCDIWEEGLEFCRRTFGAEIFRSPDLKRLSLPGSYDVIWCGSMLTHMGEDDWRAALKLWRSVLRGVLIFTTYDGAMLPNLGLSKAEEEQMGDNYERDGFSFIANAKNIAPGFGEAIASEEWTLNALERSGFCAIGYHRGLWLGQNVAIAV